MNDLEVVARFRADVPAPDPGAMAQARAAMFGEPVPRPKRSPARMAARLAPVGALAAVVAVAAALHWLPLPASPAAAPKTQRAAVNMLLLAAGAEKLPGSPAPRDDQFVYVQSVRVQPATGSAGQIVTRSQSWLSVDHRHTGQLRMLTTPSAVAPPLTQSLVPCKGCTVDPMYRDDLPTDPTVMRAGLYGDATGPDRDFQAFARAGLLVSTAYLPPDQIIALFQAASTIPGVTLVPDVVDAAGRNGVGVAVTYGGRRSELIFDPATHQYLGQTQVTADGAVDSASAQEMTAIVDRVGELP